MAQKLYARLLAMTLVECVEDITQLLGKEFRKSLDKAIAKNDHKQKLNPIVKALTEFKKKARTRSSRHTQHCRRTQDQDAGTSVIYHQQNRSKNITKPIFRICGIAFTIHHNDDRGNDWHGCRVESRFKAYK